MSWFDSEYSPNTIYFWIAALIIGAMAAMVYIILEWEKNSPAPSHSEQVVPLDASRPFSSKDDLFRSKWGQMNVPMPGMTEWETRPMPTLTKDDIFLLKWADLNEQMNKTYSEIEARLILAVMNDDDDEDEDAVPEDPDKDIPQQERLAENAGLYPGMWEASNYQEVIYIAEWYLARLHKEKRP